MPELDSYAWHRQISSPVLAMGVWFAGPCCSLAGETCGSGVLTTPEFLQRPRWATPEPHTAQHKRTCELRRRRSVGARTSSQHRIGTLPVAPNVAPNVARFSIGRRMGHMVIGSRCSAPFDRSDRTALACLSYRSTRARPFFV